MFCRYEPLFDYFKELSDTAFRVIADNYVTDDSGTGIVHCAPAFGEDDYRVCLENQIISKVCSRTLFNFRCSMLPELGGLRTICLAYSFLCKFSFGFFVTTIFFWAYISLMLTLRG